MLEDGFYHEEVIQPVDGPKQKQKVLKKIPSEVIRNAKGLAIFTTMRTGLWISGAGGSGILVGRQEDGSWSPPAGIMLHTAGLGFLVGVDIYDCVLVINTAQALAAFSKWRCTVGGEISAVAGPVGMGGMLDTDFKKQAPIFTYLKSRGFYAGVQIDGTVIIERTDENERFYKEKLPASDIVAGKVRHPPFELRMLMETLKAAQGDKDVNESYLPIEPPPADFEVVESGHVFGVPDKEDPDPYGVLALEKEGLHIKEAATKMEVPAEAFDFRPSASSPIYGTYRRSLDGQSIKSNTWRHSTVSASTERHYVTMDIATQTDFPSPAGSPALRAMEARSGAPSPMPTEEKVVKLPKGPPPTLPSRVVDVSNPLGIETQSDSTQTPSTIRTIDQQTARGMAEDQIRPVEKAEGIAEMESTTETHVPDPPPSLTPEAPSSLSPEAIPVSERTKAPQVPIKLEDNDTSREAKTEISDLDDDDDDDDDYEEDESEEAIIQDVQQATAPQVITRARLVTLAKPMPPKIPSRNPIRQQTNTAQDDVSREHQLDGLSGAIAHSVDISQPSSSEHETSGQSSKSISSLDGFHDSVTSTTSSPKKTLSFRSVKSTRSNDDSEVRDTSAPITKEMGAPAPADTTVFEKPAASSAAAVVTGQWRPAATSTAPLDIPQPSATAGPQSTTQDNFAPVSISPTIQRELKTGPGLSLSSIRGGLVSDDEDDFS